MSLRARSVELSISRSALRHNFAQAKALAAGQKVMAVVKANAYGHGAVEVAATLNEADGFAVVCLAEAQVLRDAGVKQPVLILQGPQSLGECKEMQRLDLWPVIHDTAQLTWYANSPFAQTLSAWLKVDTGMGRLGFNVSQASEILAQSDGINWFGVLSHLACADAPPNKHINEQVQHFAQVVRGRSLHSSLANSAAVIASPQTKSEWVRPGIMLYGNNPIASEVGGEAMSIGSVNLKPVMRATAPLLSRKSMPSGASIGYSQLYSVPEPMDIGLLAVGYGDGLPRVLDESASVQLHGVKCPIVGRVSMDSIAIDLRECPQAVTGDRAILWGPEHDVGILASAAGTIAYELFTSIRGHLKYSE